MLVAVPKEILPGENRVALIPASIASLTKAGLEVMVESGAGAGCFIDDKAYEEAGARLDDVGVSDDLVWANISVSDEKVFDQKKDEIDRVKKFLKDERFKVTLRSRKGLGSIKGEIYMEGK